MDWAHIRSFLFTMETGTLSAAARRLGLTQPTLGRHIQELEQALGVTLFRRSQKGLEPTDAARELLDSARAMGAEAETFARVARGEADTSGAVLRVSADPLIAAVLLPEVLADLRQRHACLTVELDTADLGRPLRPQDADLALRIGDPLQPDMVARRLNSLPLGLFAAQAYVARRGRPERIADLAEHDLIGFDRADRLIRGLTADGRGPEIRSVLMRGDDRLAAWSMVAAGLGIGLGPLRAGARLPDLVRIDLPVRLPVLEVWSAVHPEPSPGRRRAMLLAAVVDGIAALPTEG